MLIAIIALVLMLIISLVYFDQISKYIVGESQKEICKRQVQLNAYSSSLQAKVDCPITYVTIKSTPNSDGTKRRIAELMNDVRDIYDVAWSGSDLFGAQSGTYCSVYAVVDFSQKDKYVENFEKYLTTHHHDYMSKESYMDYFMNTTEGSAEAMRGKSIVPTLISTNQRYAVMFVYTKSYGSVQEYTNKVGTFLEKSPEVPGAGFTGKVATSIGGGTLIGVGGAVAVVAIFGSAVISVPVLGTMAVLSSVGSAAIFTIVSEVGEPSIGAFVKLEKYNNESDLAEIGCQYFPVDLGTRP